MHRVMIGLLMAALLVVFGSANFANAAWFVTKDKNGVCKVIEAKAKTPTTIAGPFKSQAAATKQKDKLCPKKK